MKNLFLTLCILTTSYFNAKSQFNNPGGDSRLAINAGIGFSSYGNPFYSGMDFPAKNEQLTFGGRLTYQAFHETYYTLSIIGLGVVGDFHWNRLFNLPEPWDLYSGASVNYFMLNLSSGSYSETAGDSQLRFNLRSGGRYFFTDQWGVLLEFAILGDYLSGAMVGITYVLP